MHALYWQETLVYSRFVLEVSDERSNGSFANKGINKREQSHLEEHRLCAAKAQRLNSIV